MLPMNVQTLTTVKNHESTHVYSLFTNNILLQLHAEGFIKLLQKSDKNPVHIRRLRGLSHLLREKRMNSLRDFAVIRSDLLLRLHRLTDGKLPSYKLKNRLLQKLPLILEKHSRHSSENRYLGNLVPKPFNKTRKGCIKPCDVDLDSLEVFHGLRLFSELFPQRIIVLHKTVIIHHRD